MNFWFIRILSSYLLSGGVGNNSRISIEPVHFPEPVRSAWISGPDYEEMILARQEAYYDD